MDEIRPMDLAFPWTGTGPDPRLNWRGFVEPIVPDDVVFDHAASPASASPESAGQSQVVETTAQGSAVVGHMVEGMFVLESKERLEESRWEIARRAGFDWEKLTEAERQRFATEPHFGRFSFLNPPTDSHPTVSP